MDGPFPYELEDARWWDEGLVQDFPPCGTGSLHVLPMLVKLTMEAKERKCVGCVISCFQDEDFEEAKGPPIQWRVRKREEAPPNSSNASEPEPGGDGKRELERDPSGGMTPQEGKSERRLSQEAAKGNTKKHSKPREKGEEDTTKERKSKEKDQKHPRTTSKRGQASGKPLFDAVMGGSDAESRVGRKLSGVPPWETQRECTNELIGSDLVEHEKLGKHP